MSTLILDRKHLELRTDSGAIALYENGARQTTIPIALLDRVIVRAETRLSTGVITALCEAGVALVVLSPRRDRLALLLGGPHADARIRLAHYRAALDPATQVAAARLIVRAKLAAQGRFIDHALSERPDCRKPLHEAARALDAAESALAAATSVPSLIGIEGASSAAYFAAYTALFPGSLGFGGRRRRPPPDPVNSCLSLAYTLLHAEAVRSAYTAGLDPFIGFLHAPARGRESLACDLVEPWRASIDEWVWNLFRTRTLRVEDFTLDQGSCRLSKPARSRFYADYEGFARRPRRGLARHCRLIVRHLLANAPELADGQEEQP